MEIALLLFHKSLSHVLVFFIHLSWFICTHSHGIFPTNHQSFTLCLEQWKKLLMCQNWNYLPYIFFLAVSLWGLLRLSSWILIKTLKQLIFHLFPLAFDEGFKNINFFFTHKKAFKHLSQFGSRCICYSNRIFFIFFQDLS